MRLRSLVPLLAVLACAALTGPARAQNVRIGFVDSQRIFNEYKSAQEAQDRFSREIQSWRTEADDRRRQVDELRNELKDQDPLLSEAKKLEKESTLQKAVSDYDRFVQDFWGPNGKVQRLNDEITREVIGKVRDAVELGEPGGLRFGLGRRGWECHIRRQEPRPDSTRARRTQQVHRWRHHDELTPHPGVS